MSKVSENITPEDKIITQTISIPENVKKEIAKAAKENGRSVSAEIVYRTKQTLRAEGRMLV